MACVNCDCPGRTRQRNLLRLHGDDLAGLAAWDSARELAEAPTDPAVMVRLPNGEAQDD